MKIIRTIILVAGIVFSPCLLHAQTLTVSGLNNVAAPVYVVSPGFLTVMVPYETTAGIANVQVINNGTPSNTISRLAGFLPL